jgi:hypothetical protein
MLLVLCEERAYITRVDVYSRCKRRCKRSSASSRVPFFRLP